jgi:hypothetical protein
MNMQDSEIHLPIPTLINPDNGTKTSFSAQQITIVWASHMSDNRQMSIAMQWLVDFISMVTNSTLLWNNTVTLY